MHVVVVRVSFSLLFLSCEFVRCFVAKYILNEDGSACELSAQPRNKHPPTSTPHPLQIQSNRHCEWVYVFMLISKLCLFIHLSHFTSIIGERQRFPNRFKLNSMVRFYFDVQFAFGFRIDISEVWNIQNQTNTNEIRIATKQSKTKKNERNRLNSSSHAMSWGCFVFEIDGVRCGACYRYQCCVFGWWKIRFRSAFSLGKFCALLNTHKTPSTKQENSFERVRAPV